MKRKIAIVALVVFASITSSCSDSSADELFDNVQLNNADNTTGNGGAGDDSNDPPPPPPGY